LAVLKSQSVLNFSSMSATLATSYTSHLFLRSLLPSASPQPDACVPSSVFNLSSRFSAFCWSHWESSPPPTVIFLSCSLSLSFFFSFSLSLSRQSAPDSLSVTWQQFCFLLTWLCCIRAAEIPLCLPPSLSHLLPASVAISLYCTLTKKVPQTFKTDH